MGCKHSLIVPLGKQSATNLNEKQAFFIVNTKQKKKKSRKRRKQRKQLNPDEIPLQPISASTVGGISFEIWVDSKATGTCPAHLSRKMEMDEATDDMAGVKIDEKLQRAQDRRDEKIRAMREKFELKRKLAEERIRKLQQEKEQRLERLKDAILNK